MKDKKLIGIKNILGTRYKYYFEPNIENENGIRLDGDCCFSEKIIRINPKSNYRDTMIHETCHAILYECGVNDVIDEKIIEIICRNFEKLGSILDIRLKKIKK